MVKTLPSTAGGMGSIPGWGTKVPHAVRYSQKFKNRIQFKIFWRTTQRQGTRIDGWSGGRRGQLNLCDYVPYA